MCTRLVGSDSASRKYEGYKPVHTVETASGGNDETGLELEGDRSPVEVSAQNSTR